jgi:hypothetical protein
MKTAELSLVATTSNVFAHPMLACIVCQGKYVSGLYLDAMLIGGYTLQK